jgi:tetratricopeptide (TPR) repeat protein
MRRTAVELQAHGHEEAAAELLERAIAFYESRLVRELAGDPPAAWYREQLAQVFYHAGRWSEAIALLDELASEHPGQVWLTGLLGQSHARLGDREKALEYADLLGAVEGEYLYGSPIVLQARIASLLGESERAVILLRQGFLASPGRYSLASSGLPTIPGVDQAKGIAYEFNTPPHALLGAGVEAEVARRTRSLMRARQHLMFVENRVPEIPHTSGRRWLLCPVSSG